jgi:tetratricopeptide (TPR) repeat protein
MMRWFGSESKGPGAGQGSHPLTAKQLVEAAKKSKGLGRNAEASKLYQQAIKLLGPEHNQIWNVAVNNLGTLIFEEGNLSEALKFYELAANNEFVTAMFNAGILFEKLDKKYDASYWYQKAASKGHTGASKKYDSLLRQMYPEKYMSTAKNNPLTERHQRTKPTTRLIKTPRDAELIAQEWMIYFGFSDSKVTRVGPDNGIDIISSKAIGQVKFKGVKTPREDIKMLHSDTITNGRRGIFFSLSGYAKTAITFADQVDIALFEFDYQGVPQPVNQSARYLLAH